jgi:hypothetical protein
VLGLGLGLIAASAAAAHAPGERADPAAAAAAAGGKASSKLRLRTCWMTVTFVPRPQDLLESAFGWPVDLSARFYGLPDPLLTTWTLRCKKARSGSTRVARPILSLVAAPSGLTDPSAVPLANNFAHAVVAVDTNRRKLAQRLRRGGLPAKRSGLRYEHSTPGAVPFSAKVTVPGKYRLAVGASTLDFVHDHDNTFEYRSPAGRRAVLRLTIKDAIDRFCFVSPAGECQASLRTPQGSPLSEPLGGPSAPVVLGLDHARLPRVDLTLRRG